MEDRFAPGDGVVFQSLQVHIQLNGIQGYVYERSERDIADGRVKVQIDKEGYVFWVRPRISNITSMSFCDNNLENRRCCRQAFLHEINSLRQVTCDREDMAENGLEDK